MVARALLHVSACRPGSLAWGPTGSNWDPVGSKWRGSWCRRWNPEQGRAYSRTSGSCCRYFMHLPVGLCCRPLVRLTGNPLRISQITTGFAPIIDPHPQYATMILVRGKALDSRLGTHSRLRWKVEGGRWKIWRITHLPREGRGSRVEVTFGHRLQFGKREARRPLPFPSLQAFTLTRLQILTQLRPVSHSLFVRHPQE